MTQRHLSFRASFDLRWIVCASLGLAVAACGEEKATDDDSVTTPVDSTMTGEPTAPALAPGGTGGAPGASSPSPTTTIAPSPTTASPVPTTPQVGDPSGGAPNATPTATNTGGGPSEPGGTPSTGGTGGAPAPSPSGTGGAPGPSEPAGGGAGGTETSAGGGPGAGGSPSGGGEFTLTVAGVTADANAGCANESCSGCPVYPADNVQVCSNRNVSPAMSWTPGPDETTSYAIVLVDTSNDLTHWALWNIPATVTTLPAELPSGALSGDLDGAQQRSFQGMGYFGSGACDHVYEFQVYAATTAPTGNSADAIRTALQASGAPMSFVRFRSDCPAGCTNPFPGSDCTP